MGSGFRVARWPDDLIGMAPRAEAVENLLDLDSEDVVRVVGIHGMGRDREDDSCCSYV
ncbi:TMV resistance protein N [Senna tora]|uniref:TMV resistance protein N n=1 Tax=Senna tora TaxID=362788 RepID=A0A834WP39_9FABA|nr:TMV resistance protein N [Senna tora]